MADKKSLADLGALTSQPAPAPEAAPAPPDAAADANGPAPQASDEAQPFVPAQSGAPLREQQRDKFGRA